MKQDKKSIRRFAENKFALSHEKVSGSRCEITSGSEIMIGGCKRVLVYQSDVVRLSLCDMTMEIRGDGLCIRSFFGEETQICGSITDIHFEKGNGR